MNKEDLIKFTDEIKVLWETGKIKAAIHLSGNGADNLIEIFKSYKKGDWIFSTWRSHWHWLLSRRSSEELKKQILTGKSMHIYGDRFFTSSIVGGITPIALGVAWGLKLDKSPNQVWCFIGDAAFECGITKECIRYAQGHKLPIKFVVEDNGLCVNAKTQKIWGLGTKSKVIKYKYNRRFPHAGTGEYVMF